MTVEEKAFCDKIDLVELEELMYDEFYELIAEAKNIGYKKAMRWRDPEKELPEKDEMVLIQVQIRYTDTIVKVFPSIGILSECGLTHKMRLVDTHRSNGLIIGWRPIENKNHFESRIEEAGCDFCRDEQGYTIGNMYVCDKCGRQVP